MSTPKWKKLQRQTKQAEDKAQREYKKLFADLKEFKPKKLSWNPAIRETRVVKSITSSVASTPAVEKKVYTGNLIKGIATMHKSNAVPVISQEHAEDISKMRRN